jgi:RNA polymerase sigma-70 factor (ECF subfamily)
MDTGVQARPAFEELETHRRELVAHCYRMLASPFEAEDAVQETLTKAWKGIDAFEGRASVRSWLYKIATNVCLDMLASGQRRARPMDLGPALAPVMENLGGLPAERWVEPLPGGDAPADPAEVAVSKESLRLAFVAALQALPPRQRAALLLCEVLQWKAAEAAELLDMTVPAVNSALQRARASLAEVDGASVVADSLPAPDAALLDRYVRAFEAYDLDALTSLIHEDCVQSMPPFELWLNGRDNMMTWWFGPGLACQGSKVLRAPNANGLPAFGQYKPSDTGSGFDPWALQVVDFRNGEIAEITFFLETATLFPLFGLPPRLEA